MPSFFVPTPGDLTAQESPPPGICHPRPKKNANAWGQPGGGEAGPRWDASGGGAFKMRKNSSAILYTICVYTSRKSPKRGISERNGKAVSQLLLTKEEPCQSHKCNHWCQTQQGRYSQQGIGAKSEVLRKRNYIKGGIPYSDIRFGSMH